MKLVTASAFALALAACGNNQPSPTAGQEPAPAAVAVAGPQLSATPTTPATPPAPTFASLVNSASTTRDERVDASSLGASVEAYVITRYGGAGNHDDQAQQFDLALVLFGGGKAIRVDLGRYEEIFGQQRPFGDMTATPAFTGRAFDPDQDAFDGAPKFKSKAPIVFTMAPRDVSGDTEAFVVTHEQDSLVVWNASHAWEESSSEKWALDTTIKLAKGATVATPPRVIDAPAPSGTVAVHLFDELASDGEGYRWYDVSLQLGDRVGPVADAKVKSSEDAKWVIDGSTNGLPAPLPQADAFLAHRLYSQGDTWQQRLLVGRVEDELLVWSHWVMDQPDAEWREPLIIPLPAGAKVAVR